MVGESLGSFKIDGTLGEGAMGVVYRATHEATGRAAAVKVVHKEIAQRGKAYERFQREAEILKQFRHPNIVRFYALGRFQGTSYIAMEFVQGVTLERVLADRGELPWQEVVDLGIQICDALHYAHEHGVVHRDLKPSNLMVTEAGEIKLTDFGIAKDLDKTALTATGRTLGTAAYMAPEQIRDTALVSHKTDLYALGVVLYQMLTGRPPFDGSSAVSLMHAHLNEPAPRPSAKLAEIPKALDNLVVQLMAKAPPDRPWDAAAASDTLTKIREKASRGETVPMVWATQGADTRSTDAGKKPKKGGKTSAGAKQGWRGWGLREGVSKADRERLLGTAALLAALLAVSGVIAYMVWPPGMPYLYKNARRLMASADRHHWYEARDNFLEPLDHRFPDHPYKQATRDWRDKILLADVEGRARVLQSAANTALNRPNDKAEERFVEYYALASAAKKRGDDLAAAAVYDELAHQYRPDDRNERAWFLLSRKRAENTRAVISQRRGLVGKLLAQAAAAAAAGRPREAVSIRAEVLQRFGSYSDLADLLGPAPPDSPPAPPDDAQKPKPAIDPVPHRNP